MKIIRTPNYISRLQILLEYIGKDKFSVAKKFKSSLDVKIDKQKNIIEILEIFNQNLPIIKN